MQKYESYIAFIRDEKYSCDEMIKPYIRIILTEIKNKLASNGTKAAEMRYVNMTNENPKSMQ